MIPERQPVADQLNGVVLRKDGTVLLTRSPLLAGETILSGDLTIRYGVQYLGKPHLAIVPGLIALDYGDMITGEDAWDFLLHHSNLHPRADVVGYRADGSDDMVAIKYLDLAAPVQVLVYRDSKATRCFARLEAFIGEAADLPSRILEYLPHFESLADWQQAPAHE
jgi:hypothetical protein